MTASRRDLDDALAGQLTLRQLLLVTSLLSALLLGALSLAEAAPTARSAPRVVVLLGGSGVGSHRDDQAPGRSVAFRFTALRSGTSKAIHLYVDRLGRGVRLSVALYRSTRGRPAALLAQGSLRHPTARRWNSIALRGASVGRGATYWVAVLATHGRVVLRFTTTRSCRGVSKRGLRRLPGEWSSARGRSTCVLSAYISGTQTATRAPAPPNPGRPGNPAPPAPTPPPPPTPTGTLHCFTAPGACGYPDPNYGNVGVPAGTALTNSGPITVNTPGAVINGLNISGGEPGIDIQAPNVTVENTRVTVTGGGCGFQSTCGNADIKVESGATGAKISHVELATDSSSTVEHAIRNFPDGTQVDHAYINGPDALAWAGGNMTVSDSYSRISLRIQDDHLENIYCPGSETITLNHNTFENQAGQVAASIFCDTNGGSGGTCSSHLTVTNNFMVGGGYDLYECGNASSQGSASLIFTGNDIARCTTRPIVQTHDGGYNCNGAPFEPNSDDATLGSADQNGFFPFGGHYGVDSYTYCNGNGSTWSGNYYDDNGSTVRC